MKDKTNVVAVVFVMASILSLVEGFKAEPVIFAGHANQTQVKTAIIDDSDE